MFKIALLTLFSSLCLETFTTSVAKARSEYFGSEWVHSHPFQIMALTLRDSLFDINEYTSANLNNTLVWETQPATRQASAKANVPWIQRYPALNGPDAHFQSVMNSLASIDRNVGFLINDEPGTTAEFTATGNALDWLKTNYPDRLAFSNIYGYGGASNLPTFVDNYLSLARPDVLMFDNYPFTLTGTESTSLLNAFYRSLGVIRNKGLQANLPYWTFIQSYNNTSAQPLSDSDMRVQVFASLAHGFTGLAYYTYDPPDDTTRGLLNLDGSPTLTYPRVTQINAEVGRLGNTLKSLKSEALGYVSTGSLASGLSRWNTSNGPYISSIAATNLGILNGGRPGDVIVGNFTLDDALEHLDGTQFENESYFMITNLLRSHSADAIAARQSIRIGFDFKDSGINSLQRLNRLTGEVEILPLIHDGGSLYHLNLILDGGTGDLFKFNTGAPFVIPEPKSFVTIVIGTFFLTSILARRTFCAKYPEILRKK